MELKIDRDSEEVCVLAEDCDFADSVIVRLHFTFTDKQALEVARLLLKERDKAWQRGVAHGRQQAEKAFAYPFVCIARELDELAKGD